MNKKIVHTVFEHTAKTFPENVAVEDGRQRIQYDDLNREANKIAHALHENRVAKDTVAALFLPGSIDYIAAVLGVLKSGGVFMPLDIDSPEKRTEYILNNTSPKIIITNTKFKENFLELISKLDLLHSVETIIVLEQRNSPFTIIQIKNNETQSLKKDYPDSDLPVVCEPDDSSYIIHTSGSTGNPKAILGQHKSLSHFIHWEIQEFGFDENIKVSLLAPTTFDVSFRDIFVPLLSGGTLCIPEQETRTNIAHLVTWMEESQLSLVHCVPTLFRLILKEIEKRDQPVLPHLKYMLLAGEALYGSDVIAWKEQAGDHISLVNLYGPSETTLAKIYHPINNKPLEKNKIIPLGKPISNTVILILKENTLCRVGEIGEIYIKTPFMSKGYYNAPELTAAAFIQNPLHSDGEDIIYKTGDLGRYLEDRTIEFVGRLDGQVKINGIRIELNEIESVLFLYDDIDRPFIVAHAADEHELRVICYYTEKKPVDITKLRGFMKQWLPDYMIPSFFVQLDEFPLNLNGKIDKKALPKPQDIIYAKIKYQEPTNKTEAALATLFEEVLGLEKVGINNSFFEIGGNSLSAIRIISRIYQSFEREITIQEFFAHDTIKKLGSFILNLSKIEYAGIEPLETREYYDLSHAQRRLWIIDQLEKGLVNYNLPGACLLKGEIDTTAFHHAFQLLIDRHESLRTIFIMKDGSPRQKILKDVEFVLERIDLENEPDNRAFARKLVEKESLTPFDLSKFPLLRAKLLKLAGNLHVLVVNMHHIISDALSIDVVMKEMIAFYTAYKKGESAALQELHIHYKDYAAWQNLMLDSGKAVEHSTYWHEKLSGELPVLNLPSDFPRPKIQTFNGATISFDLDCKEEFLQIAKSSNATLFMVIISLVKILFYRYTSQEDIILGTPIAGRNHADLTDQVGFYVNMLPLRDTVRAEDTFLELLKKVSKTAVKAYEHQMYPFDKLVEDLELTRDMSRSPVFDVMVVMHSQSPKNKESKESSTNQMVFDDVEISEFDFGLFTSKYDVTFTITETDADTLGILLEYNTDLFCSDRMERMKNHFTELAKNIINDPTCTVAHVNILPQWEKDKILFEFNDTATDYPHDKTIAAVFEQKVRQTPDNQAVVYEGIFLSYRELNASANQLAHILREKFDIGLEDRAAILLNKSERMVISILGVLKSGGACMCIDPMYPEERIQYILKDADCRVVLSEGKYLTDIISSCPDIQAFDISEFGIKHPDFDIETADPKPLGNGEALAYVIYTSGSTGRPKGTLINQKTALRLVLNTNYINVRESDRILQTVSFSFDVSVFEIWGALLNGASVYLIPDKAVVEADKMQQYISDYKITIMWLTTSLFNELADAKVELFKGLEMLMVGGEKLSAPHINRVKKAHPGLRVVNGYGPTENGTFTTYHQIDKFYKGDVPVGYPISNTEVIILDQNNEIVPIGIAGEICTSGDGLARGYLNRPELTKEQFIPHPYKPGELMYRIGDLASWMPNGCIECFGRNDDQVKIRGYRIELGEIQNRLLEHPLIRQAVVLERLNQSSQTKELTAYFVCKDNAQQIPELSDLRRFMGAFLPEYMVPAYFVHMEVFLLNANGKVDRNMLPSPGEAAMNIHSLLTPPKNAIESKLLKVWQRILGKKEIGIDDNYFAIGGDSIKAIQIVSSLHDEDLKIEVKDIFLKPTIAELAEKVIKIKQLIDQGMVTGNILLTPVQCWFFDNYKQARHHFNQSEMLYSKNGFQEDALRTALAKVQEHHDALRMTFGFEDSIEDSPEDFIDDSGEVIQINCDTDYPLDFEVINLSEDVKAEDVKPEGVKNDLKDAASHIEALANEIQAGINLKTGPLMKVALFRGKDGDRLLIVLHHLVIDGISWRILAEDISCAYSQCLNGETVRLPSKTHSFKYWSEQLQKYALSDELLAEKRYWETIESTKITPLPDDFKEEGIDTSIKDTSTIDFSLSEQDTALLLTKVNHAYNTEINDILLTALARAMKSWHGKNQTLINIEGHGRELLKIRNQKPEINELDVSRTIGWFTSMYPLILKLPDSEDIGNQIKFVKESLRNIPNKGMGYNVLKYLTPAEKKKDISFSISPQVSFNYLGQFDQELDDLFEPASESSGNNVSLNSECLYDIDMNSIVIQKRLQISVTYNKKRFDERTIEKLGADFTKELLFIARHCAGISESEITPADIDYDGLDIEELDELIGNLE